MKTTSNDTPKVDPIKKVLFKKTSDPEKGHKSITLAQTNEDQDSVTNVIKTFRYRVALSDEVAPEYAKPEVYIQKLRDAKQQLEQFDFRVQGCFYVAHQRLMYKVEFQHELHIDIYWKTSKVFSPKKSVVLT